MNDLIGRICAFRDAFRATHSAGGQTIGLETYQLRCSGHDLSVLDEAADEITQLREALRGMLLIVDDSDGVAGYHLNGMVAAWSEFHEVEQARVVLGGKPNEC